jgi:hypothetical protein
MPALQEKSPQLNPGSTEKQINNIKRAGRVAEVVVCLPSKIKALSSTPSTIINK